MLHFNFIATNDFNLEDFNDIEKFIDKYPDFQTVPLATEDEFKKLLELIGIPDLIWQELDGDYFLKYCDISNHHLPEMSEDDFNKFYEDWIEITGRDNNMDEFGSLIFLQGLSSKWNRLKHRLIVLEVENGA